MITGLILAGGRSQRMGGGDKTLLTLSGTPMLAHVLERFAPQVGALAINANGDPARFAAFGRPVIADAVPDFAGPLAGVLAGLRWSASADPVATRMATVSGDTPFLPPDLVTRLATATSKNGIALAASGGNIHPVIGLWPIALAEDLAASLAAGTRKVQSWAAGHGATVVDFPFVEIGGRSIDPFFNANTPEDFDEARRLFEAVSHS